MSIVLHHHPFSRAANVLWMLEEVGVPYELRFVDFAKGAHKSPEMLALNPMGKLPVLTDGDVVVTEGAAIGLYLADRYSYGNLAPKHDDPARAPYLRWSFFAPSVIEPGVLAKSSGWEVKTSQVGWGTHEAMAAAIDHALAKGPWVAGERFTMADCIFGGTLAFFARFKQLDPTPAVAAYLERIKARPARQKADATNGRVVAEHGLAVRT